MSCLLGTSSNSAPQFGANLDATRLGHEQVVPQRRRRRAERGERGEFGGGYRSYTFFYVRLVRTAP